jgi:hypothetical protein
VGGGFFCSLIDMLLKVIEHAFTERLQAFSLTVPNTILQKD